MIQIMIISHLVSLGVDAEYNTGDCAQNKKNSEITQEKCEILPIMNSLGDNYPIVSKSNTII